MKRRKDTLSTGLREPMPKVKEIAYRPIPKGEDLDQIFSIKEKTRVQGDNTIHCYISHSSLPDRLR